MDFNSKYENRRNINLHRHQKLYQSRSSGEMLKDSTMVVRAIGEEIRRARGDEGEGKAVGLTLTIPAFFVLGKAYIDVSNCATKIREYASTNEKPMLLGMTATNDHLVTDLYQQRKTSSKEDGNHEDDASALVVAAERPYNCVKVPNSFWSGEPQNSGQNSWLQPDLTEA
ncbi:hypothetical protein AKJ16_DCAP11082 [Drosera capensis]